MARQKLGQHFLTSGKTLERIATAACGERTDFVIEIGPGRGALTERLLLHADRVAAIELDPELVTLLRERWGHEPRFSVTHQDAMDADWTVWGAAVLAGNLPYYVASALITNFAMQPGELRHGVFLIQKEVAERIAARPGHREYGYLSVVCQFFTSVELLFSVPPGAFSPPPKVDSAVVRLTPRHDVPEVDRARFARFVGVCFQQKRKTLRNNLLSVAPRAVLDTLPGLERRGEQLTPLEFLDLYRRLNPVTAAETAEQHRQAD